MKLFAGISVQEGGIYDSIRGMRADMKMMDFITQNMMKFGQVGYQRQIPVKTSFAEYIGSHGVEAITDTSPGRFRLTGNPLDLIVAEKGYFQIQGQNSVEMTRDGRFKIDKNGFLVSLDDKKVLSASGETIHFAEIPQDYKDVKVDEDGSIYMYNRAYKQKIFVDKLGVASETGTLLDSAKVQQGYVEDSNVVMSDEAFNILPIRRNITANKQAFMIQNENMNKLIQMLGRGQ